MFAQVDRNLCISAAPCVAIAGDVFQLDDEGKAIIVGPITDEKAAMLAAEACPVRAIFLYDDNKNQIYPSPKQVKRDYVENN